MAYSRICRIGPILCALASLSSAALRADEAPLFPTRQSTFEIPFQIPAPAPGQEPVEVQLHVSENRGGNWNQHAKVAPTAGRFAFRAEHDGEYWFLVRTLNQAGKLLPEGPFAPELRVLVDTQPPAIKLTCDSPEAGKIRCVYSVADPSLKAETVDVVCRGVDAASLRRPTSLQPAAGTRPNEEAAATALFDVDLAARGPLFVRVTATDAAGNVTTEERQVEVQGVTALNPNALPAVTSNQPLPAFPPTTNATATPSPPQSGPWKQSALPSQPHVTPPSETLGAAPRPDGEPPSMARAFPGSENIPKPSWSGGGSLADVEPVPTGRAAAPFAPASTPAGATPYSAAAPSKSLAGGGPEVESLVPGEAEALPIPTPTPTSLGTSSATDRVTAGPSFGDAAGGPQLTPQATPYETQRPSTTNSLPAPTGGEDLSPSGVRPRLVNSRRFELDYDIESVGTAGVAKVELFGTRDGGKSWASLGNDPDSTSPFVVNVDGEGTYGFRMVIESTTGLRSAAPEAGDLPEVWVGVDVTKPAAKIVAAAPGTGERTGELDIRWEAGDENISARPIALAFSTEASGPWNIIASGLPNQGHYAWRIDSRTPGQVYLKLDVRDEAGNVGTFITPEPVMIERVRPQGRIRGVRPIGESARLRMPASLPVR